MRLTDGPESEATVKRGSARAPARCQGVAPEPAPAGDGAGAPAPRLHVLRSGSETPCGVETFARRLVEAAGPRGRGLVLGGSPAPRGPGALVVNLPVVAWKRALAAPVLAALGARMRGLSVVVVLHEWDDLDPRRRASYLPLLVLADGLLFSCAAVERQFSRSPAAAVATRRRGLVPVPPNVSRPVVTLKGRDARRLAAERAAGRLVLGCFGSIYPKKDPAAVLEVAAELRRRGHDPFVIFAGSFVRGADSVERDFAARVTALGLDGAVTVTGYIASEAELYGVLEEVDVFVYRFAEGLTPRRSSVSACLLSGRPVVVNAPRDPGDLGGFRAFRDAGTLRLVSPGADAGAYADAVLAARAHGPVPPARIDLGAAWAEALAVVEAAGASRPRFREVRHA